MIYNDLPKSKRFTWAAVDTETYTLIDGKIVSIAELNKLGTQHETAWFREHASVQPYAWILSVGKYDAICSDFIEWLELISWHHIKTMWFYNAKFDFAQIDYQLLTRGFVEYSAENKAAKLNMYESLHSEFGQRYQLKLWYVYENKEHKKVYHKIVIYDLCNIFGGGLRKLLNDFDIHDENGNPIRKLEMDYQDNQVDGKFTDEAIEYMKIDGKGLYYLVLKCHEYVSNHYNMNMLPKPDFMTAGGFAKRYLLHVLYNKENYAADLKEFQKQYIMWKELDTLFRYSGLYRGGICFVNKKYQNKLISNEFQRFDYNSHYPSQMHESIALKGRLYKQSYEDYLKSKDDSKFIYILHLKSWRGVMKPDMLPVWYDSYIKKYTETPDNPHGNDLLIFAFEFEEYINYWYDMEYECDFVYAYERQYDYNYAKFVDILYAEKNAGKKEKNACKQAFSKLGLNSSYGKLAQNPERAKTHREINEETGAVHLVLDGYESDDSNIMSVAQGALITAMGRVKLVQSIRTKCKTTPANDFYYCDTDSIHGIFETDANQYELGALKLEASCNYGLFLAPKTYFEVDCDGFIEIHTKGVPISTIYNVMIQHDAIEKIENGINIKYKLKDINKVIEIFKAGNKFQCLASLNLKGGKGLIPLFKELCKIENTITYDNANDIASQNYEIELFEV